MKRLTKQQVLWMHERLTAQTGGDPSLRDEGLMEAALEGMFQTFGGAELYPTAFDKAACLGYGLVKNHAFVDGNKRIGAHAMLVFLALNGIELEYTQTELSGCILRVAEGAMGQGELRRWLEEHLCQETQN